MIAVDIQNLTKAYRNNIAVKDLSLRIEANQIFGFVGPDGAGKTSLFRILCGILTPTSGKVSVLGFDVTSQPEEIKKELGYMSQKFALYADLTVKENIRFFADLFNAPKRGLLERINELLHFAGLSRFQNRLAGNLSGGMKQKLALCCTLIHTPKILVLDEPTTGIDPVSRHEFWEILLTLPAQGTTVILSTAYMDEASRCDKVALMNKGQILRLGSPSELKKPLDGKIFEVRGSGLYDLKRKLSALEWLDEVQVFGDRLHVKVKENVRDKGKKEIENFLTEAGFEVNVNAAPPSLEDVFIDLMKENDRRG